MGIRLKNEEFVNRVVRGTGVIHKLDSLAELETFKDKFEGTDSEKDGLQVSIDNKIYTFNSNAMDTNFGWIENKVKLTDPSVVASGYLNKKVKSEQFVFPDEPNRVYSTGETVVFDGEVFEVGENTLIALPEAPTTKVETSATTANAYVKGEYAVLDVTNIDDKSKDTFSCIQSAPVGTDLNDTTYFQDRTDIGVTNQVLITHKYNKTNKTYDGYHTEILYDEAYATDSVDTIMTKNRFSIGGKGLFSKDDDENIPTAVVHRTLSNSIYHPWLNPNGCYKDSNNKFWHESDFTLEKKSDCFTNIGTVSGRPDERVHNKIYPNQLIDLRISATTTPDGELLARELRNDLSGATEGVEGVEGVIYAGDIQVTGSSDRGIWSIYVSNIDVYRIYKGSNYITPDIRAVYVFQIEGIKFDLIHVGSGIFKRNSIIHNNVYHGLPVDNTLHLNCTISKQLPILSQGTQLTTDLIGSPDNYPQSLKDILNRGVAVHLNPLLIDDEGNSAIPTDGSSYNYKLSKRTSSSKHLFLNTNTGNYEVTGDRVLNTSNKIENDISDYDFDNSRLFKLYQYQSKNHILQLYTDGTPLTEDLVVYASNTHDLTKGATIANSLTNKVSTGTDATETLTVTKVVDDVITHTAPTQTPDVLFRARLERDTATGMKKIVYEYDDALINGTQKQQRLLNEY